MARYILLSIFVFITIVFLFTALKGFIRRLAGRYQQQPLKKTANQANSQSSQVIFSNNSTTVLQGEAKQKPGGKL